ncbi:D12 class N6 adenine-specific DNA methyltransferase family protein [Carnobacterium maltaromaticum LMA28]|uniref:D12 class N6 adenine-specific DNA methyltransferase family protein n=1 Tax=Carnobacterium maltaromaticum LMA28 TaxID=1234679 RepID=K8ERY3_CARML|nr:DNA adenine methylase [Carnobacterium maltaromaticum]CCO11316.2 D12 class N6 adenine-specific DNA methyltransferase family protein [Carnobacterium maltaromaticum LMA28]
MKRILNYPGSKWKMADFIISFFPEHSTYLEPFTGSGAVFFNKEPSKVETLNDLDSRIVNFLKICRDRPQELVRVIQLTPLSREEYLLSYETSPDPLEDARRLMIRCWQAIGAKTSDKTGWRALIESNGSNTAKEWKEIWQRIIAVADRLRDAQIEHQDAIQLLSRYNRKGVLAYVDPPYLLETRSKRHYKHEFTDADHEALLDCLVNFKGNIILSGYESEMYNTWLKGWHKEYFSTNAEAGAKREEVLWMNFQPAGQIDLIELLEESV